MQETINIKQSNTMLYTLSKTKKNKPLIIFGAGFSGRFLYKQIKQSNPSIDIIGFVDSNIDNGSLYGIDILPLKEALCDQPNQYQWLISSHVFKDEIYNTLSKSGVYPENILIPDIPLCQTQLPTQIEKIKQINTITYFPQINDKKTFNKLTSKLKWYLPYSPDQKVTINIYYSGKVDHLPENINVINKTHIKPLHEADAIFVWNKNALNDDQLNTHRKKTYCVDETFFSHIEARNYRSLKLNTTSEYQINKTINRSLFNLRALHQSAMQCPSYIFGSGPSIEDLVCNIKHDSLGIFCNSTIKNSKLISQCRIKCFVFNDPVFYSSHNTYSQKFIQDLVEAVKQPNTYWVTSLALAILITSHYPELKKGMIALPVKNNNRVLPGTQFHSITPENFYTGLNINILTIFAIPIATGISSQIYIAGCDGQDPSRNNSWSYSRSSSYNKYTNDVYNAHPSYFDDLDFNNYYQNHYNSLSIMLEHFEKSGKEFRTLTKSFIPALYSRY